MKRALGALLIAGALLVIAAPAGAEPSAADARRQAEQILGRSSQPEKPDENENGTPRRDRPQRETPTSAPSTGFDASPIATVLLVIVVAGLVGLIGWAVIRWLRDRGPRSEDDDEDDDEIDDDEWDLGLTDDDEALRLSPPEELERLADDAEAAGDFARAVRYRFRAGILRLADAGVLTLTPSHTTGQLRRDLARPRFDSLASRFDEIVYGDRTADSSDVQLAKTEWPVLQREAARA